MTLEKTIQATTLLLGFSLLIQSLEMLAIHKKIGQHSAWDWNHIRGEFNFLPQFLQKLLDWFYAKHFKDLVWLQLSLIALLEFYPRWPFSLLLALTCLLIGWRFKGVFNGGSDYMTMAQLLGLTLSLSKPNNTYTLKLGLYYIALQTTLSYFIAGVVKLRNRSWRNGMALEVFLSHSNYSVPRRLQSFFRYPLISIASAWGVILWECLFPAIWLMPTLTPVFLMMGFLFHLGNFFTFGLNRFVFAWIASYPAIVFCTMYR